MKQKTLLAVGAAGALAVLAPVGPAVAKSSNGTTVTVRIEGLNKELLAAKSVKVPTSGSYTKGGTPSGKCPADSAVGALNVATHGKWGGTYSSSQEQTEITSILGESHPFTSNDYWDFVVNNKAASVGACDFKPHRGNQILFAAVSDSAANAFPVATKAPATATVGKAFKVDVVYYNAKGKAKPLAGATVDGKKTNASGVVKLTAHKAGKLVLKSTKKGYIRAAAVTVTVAG
jgi:Domain of unknown function (DUF4430)